MKSSKNIVVDYLGRLYKIDNLNNKNIYNKVEPALESLGENFALNKEDVLHPTCFKTFMRFQQKGKSLIEIVKKQPNNDCAKQFYGAGKKYSLICKHGKIVIPKQIHRIE